MVRVGDDERSSGSYDDGAVGVYVHLPFCDRICPYCDFAVVAARPLSRVMEDRTLAALVAELRGRQKDFEGRKLASVYFGGGTPSLFQPDSIARLIETVHALFPSPLDPDEIVETTLELNPSTVERSRLEGFREAGVNRLSIGVQSFDDNLLRRLGRAHRATVAHETLEAARRVGFDNLSIDLIIAGPEQTLSDLDRDLEALIAWEPEHVSTYELTYEPETPFGRALVTGQLKGCDEDLAVEMIGRTQNSLEHSGWERYEISNYARPGYRARHNARYWRRQAVLGVGMSAHSFESRSASLPHGARRANPRELESWFAAVARDPGRVGCQHEETLSVAAARGEAVFLALRQREGVCAFSFEQEFGGAPRQFFAEEIQAGIARGWLEEEDTGDFRMSEAGRLLADSVAAEFVVLDE